MRGGIGIVLTGQSADLQSGGQESGGSSDMLSGLLRAGIAALHGWAQTWVSGSRRAWKLPRRASFWLFLAGSERAGGHT